MNLPTDYQLRMKKLLEADYEHYLESFEHTIGQTFRVNPLKTEPAELFRRFHAVRGDCRFRPVDWCRTGFYYDGTDRLSLHPFYHAGLYYLQEPSAMAPAAFLPVEPGDRVLDLCAAPGGKTTALGGKLKGKGLLVANDISISRCRALLKNVQMAGIGNAVVTCETPERLAGHFPEYFDKILVDAPCSGEGMFRRDPGMVKAWSVSEVERYSSLQKEILSFASAMLRPGGCILYSTCTYSPEENEQVIETLLGEGEFSLLPLPRYHGVEEGRPGWSPGRDPSLRNCRRFWNHRVEGEGQFAALLKKSEKTEGRSGKKPGMTGDRKIRIKGGSRKRIPRGTGDGLPEECTAFLRHLTPEAASLFGAGETELVKKDERVFLVPGELSDLSGLRVVSSGLYIGDCRKKRFEPAQALAMALKAGQFDHVLKLSSSDQRVDRYLKCETIEADIGDGWCLICVEEFPLGWGKAKGGRIKNKYPAGWRRQS